MSVNTNPNDIKTQVGGGNNNTAGTDSSVRNGDTGNTGDNENYTGASGIEKQNGFISSTISPLKATVVDAPTHLKMAAGALMYDKKYDIDDIPDLSGAASMFNKFSSFKYYMCGPVFGSGYDPKSHFDFNNPNLVIESSSTKSSSNTNGDSASTSGATNSVEATAGATNTNEKIGTPLKFSNDSYANGVMRWAEISQNYYNNYRGEISDLKRRVSTTDSSGNLTGEVEVADNLSSYLSTTWSDRPTADVIINASKTKDKDDNSTTRLPYDWNDFLYCKWYGKIPNNRLITLRRYMFPVDDMATNHENQLMVPIAQAVTYFGEGTGNTLSSILKMTWGLNWSEVESRVQDVDGNERGWGQGVEGMFGGNKLVTMTGKVAAFARGAGIRGTDANSRWDGSGTVTNNWLKKAYMDDGAYWNVILGPVNVVNKTHRRDRGFKWQNDISLKFTFSLRSYYGVNPRIAALDIISNMLRLTNNNGKWWGGAMRYFPNMQHHVGFLGNQEFFYKNDWEGYFKSVRDEVVEMGKTLLNRAKNVQLPEFSALARGDFKGFLESAKEFLSSFMGSMGNQAVSMAMGKLASADRPELLSIRSLLEGRPVGEWHLVVGNPLNPIAVMGNMLVDGCDFEVNEELGVDDFPTELVFTVKLKHARPREIGDIESIFNLGFGRMSYTPLVAGSTEFNTFGSSSTELQASDKKKKSEYLSSLSSVDDKMTINKGVSKETSLKANESDIKTYCQMSQFTVDGIKQKIAQTYGKAWSESEYLKVMIQKSKLKS